MESIVARGIAMIVTLLLLAEATVLGYSAKNTATYQNQISAIRQISADIMMMQNESASMSSSNLLASLYNLQLGKYSGTLPGGFVCTSATACTDFNSVAITAGTSTAPYLFLFSLKTTAQCSEYLSEIGSTNFYIGATSATMAVATSAGCALVPGTNIMGGYVIQ